MKLVNPEHLPDPVGFSHAVETMGERILHVAGQVGVDGDGAYADGLVAQFELALVNVKLCLDEAGFPPDSLTRMVIYTTSMDEYRESLAPIGEAYRGVLGRHFPAMALIGVSELFDPQAQVEILATAVL